MILQVSEMPARCHCVMAHREDQAKGCAESIDSPGTRRARATRAELHRQFCSPAALVALVSMAVLPAWAEAGQGSEPSPAAMASSADLEPAAALAPVSPCESPLLAAALAAHERLCQAEACAPEDLAVLDAAIAFLKSCAARQAPAALHAASARPSPTSRANASRWIFPVSRMRPQDSMGGPDGKGYLKNRRVKCYASARAGHPAHDLFVRDRRQSGRDRQGRPFEALAVEEGYVLAVKQGWTPESEGGGGNYVLLYLPAKNWVAYYAHLESVAVRAGDRLAAGALIGVIGRSGRNAWQSRSPTHLHFAIWNPSDAWMPLDPYALLRSAITLAEPRR